MNYTFASLDHHYWCRSCHTAPRHPLAGRRNQRAPATAIVAFFSGRSRSLTHAGEERAPLRSGINPLPLKDVQSVTHTLSTGAQRVLFLGRTNDMQRKTVGKRKNKHSHSTRNQSNWGRTRPRNQRTTFAARRNKAATSLTRLNEGQKLLPATSAKFPPAGESFVGSCPPPPKLKENFPRNDNIAL